jgi:hypothetical protein
VIKKRMSTGETAATCGQTATKKPRRLEFQGGFSLPDSEVPAPFIVEGGEAEQPYVPELPLDYPQLRILLRDSGVAFKPRFSQAECAELFGKSTRTVRNWIRKAQVPFHLWPSGEPYFTPQDLEDILAGTARESRRGN